jgi:hypothetical protein
MAEKYPKDQKSRKKQVPPHKQEHDLYLSLPQFHVKLLRYSGKRVRHNLEIGCNFDVQ